MIFNLVNAVIYVCIYEFESNITNNFLFNNVLVDILTDMNVDFIEVITLSPKYIL